MTKRTPKPAEEPQAPATPPALTPKSPRPNSKLAAIAEKLKGQDGVTVAEIQMLTGWQEHSIRGALAETLKKKLGLTIVSEKLERGRVYRSTRSAAMSEAVDVSAQVRQLAGLGLADPGLERLGNPGSGLADICDQTKTPRPSGRRRLIGKLILRLGEGEGSFPLDPASLPQPGAVR